MKAITPLSLAVFSLKNFIFISEHYQISKEVRRKSFVVRKKGNSEKPIKRESIEKFLKRKVRAISLDLKHTIDSKNNIVIESTINSFDVLRLKNNNSLSLPENSKKNMIYSHRNSKEYINKCDFPEENNKMNSERKKSEKEKQPININLNENHDIISEKMNFLNLEVPQNGKFINIFFYNLTVLAFKYYVFISLIFFLMSLINYKIFFKKNSFISLN